MQIPKKNHRAFNVILNDLETYRIDEKDRYETRKKVILSDRQYSTSDKVVLCFILTILAIGLPAFAPISVFFMIIILRKSNPKVTAFKQKSYNAIIQNKLEQELCPNLTRMKQPEALTEAIKNSKLLKGHISITNHYKGVDKNRHSFTFANVKTYGSGNKVTFRGLFVKIDTSLTSKGIIIRKKHDQSTRGITKLSEKFDLSTINPPFAEKYEVYSKNHAETELLLTTTFLFPLIKLNRLFSEKLVWSYKDNAIYLIIPGLSTPSVQQDVNDSFKKNLDFIKEFQKSFMNVALIVNALCSQEQLIRLQLKDIILDKRKKEAEAFRKRIEEQNKSKDETQSEEQLVEILDIDLYQHLIL